MEFLATIIGTILTELDLIFCKKKPSIQYKPTEVTQNAVIAQKSRELKLFIFVLILSSFLSAPIKIMQDGIDRYCRVNLPRNLCGDVLLFCIAMTPIKSSRQLNIMTGSTVWLFNILVLITVYHEQATKAQFTHYPHFFSFMTVQLYLLLLSELHWKTIFAQIAGFYSLYAVVVSYLVGFSNIPKAHLFDISFAIIFQVRIISLKRQLYNDLTYLYEELMDGKELLQTILKILPEGIIILNKDSKKGFLDFANVSAIKILNSNQDNYSSLVSEDQSNNGAAFRPRSESQEVLKEEFEKYLQTMMVHFKAVPEQPLMEEELKEGDEPSPLLNSESNQRGEMTFLQMVEAIRYQENEVLILPQSPQQHTEIFKRSIKNNSQTLVILKDVTHIREKEKAKWTQKMQTMLLSSITHDLKTPLNSAMAFNQSLASARELSCSERKMLKMQLNSCLFMQNLIEDIMDLSRFEFDKFKQQPSLFRIRDLVDETIDIIELQAQSKRLEVLQRIDIDVPEFVKTDRKRLLQVMLNLVSNALKFTLQGSILIKIAYKEQASQQEDPFQELEQTSADASFDSVSSVTNRKDCYLKVSVIDTGLGISQQNLPKLFQLFGMLQSTQHINRNGTGLGLCICKKICEAMGGWIKVKSEEGIGSKFKFSVKLVQPEEGELFPSPPDSRSRVGSLSYNMTSHSLKKMRSFQSIFQHQTPKTRGHVRNRTHHQAATSMSQKIDFDLEEEVCPSCKRILIIDDNNLNIFALQLQLMDQCSQEGAEAYNGQDGLERLEEKLAICCKKPYTLVIVDLNMPVMGGIELINAVKRKMAEVGPQSLGPYRNTHFTLCTAQSEQEFGNYREIGFNSYLEKPVQSKKLRKILEDCRLAKGIK